MFLLTCRQSDVSNRIIDFSIELMENHVSNEQSRLGLNNSKSDKVSKSKTPKDNSIFGDFSYRLNSRGVELLKYTGKSTTVVLPSEINGTPVVKIGKEAFINNRDVVSVHIPYGVMEIDVFAFANCSNLSTVELPDSMVKIWSFAFNDSDNLSISTKTEIGKFNDINIIAETDKYDVSMGLHTANPSSDYIDPIRESPDHGYMEDIYDEEVDEAYPDM